MRVAFSSIAWNTGSSSPGDELIIRSTSEVAVCCSNDSLNCRSSHAIFVFWSAVALRRLPVFGVLAALGATVLRLRALASLLLALERRRIAHPKA
jgi:hypothetical protein